MVPASPLAPVSWSVGWHDGPALLIDTLDGRGSVRAGPGGLVIQSPEIRLSLKRLALPAGVDLGALAGEASLMPATIECGYTAGCDGKLPFRVQGMAIRMFPGEYLADGSGELVLHRSGEFDGRIVLDGGGITGELHVRRRGAAMPTIKGWLAPTSRASPGLTATVRGLGPAGPKGVIIDYR